MHQTHEIKKFGHRPHATAKPMKHIVFDIETIAQDEARLLALAPEFTAPANLKDPEKIAAAIAKRRADYVADAALNWKTAEVVLIGAGDDTQIQSFTASTEKESRLSQPIANLAHLE